MRYKAGDRVRIVEQRTENMNTYGEMDKWLGKIMTICGHTDVKPYYSMEEDGGKWYWYDEMIAGLAEPELTAEEVLTIVRELPYDFIHDFLGCCYGRSREAMLLNVATPQQLVDMCRQWKAEHEKKEPEIETVDICRIIEILPNGRRRCVHEEDINSELPFGGDEREKVEKMLKAYCTEHEGEFIAVHEVISRVKAVN